MVYLFFPLIGANNQKVFGRHRSLGDWTNFSTMDTYSHRLLSGNSGIFQKGLLLPWTFRTVHIPPFIFLHTPTNLYILPNEVGKIVLKTKWTWDANSKQSLARVTLRKWPNCSEPEFLLFINGDYNAYFRYIFQAWSLHLVLFGRIYLFIYLFAEISSIFTFIVGIITLHSWTHL